MQITGGRSSSKFDGKLICKADDGSPQIYTGVGEGSSNNGGGGASATPGMGLGQAALLVLAFRDRANPDTHQQGLKEAAEPQIGEANTMAMTSQCDNNNSNRAVLVKPE
uniref:Uncharacterized protein n=1 Tax=Oryza glumipatula TaxID=40148 RepID=A0A0E0BMS0_9ORYZ